MRRPCGRGGTCFPRKLRRDPRRGARPADGGLRNVLPSRGPPAPGANPGPEPRGPCWVSLKVKTDLCSPGARVRRSPWRLEAAVWERVFLRSSRRRTGVTGSQKVVQNVFVVVVVVVVDLKELADTAQEDGWQRRSFRRACVPCRVAHHVRESLLDVTYYFSHTLHIEKAVSNNGRSLRVGTRTRSSFPVITR